ncbi:MAG TPA: A/G-specific adenine glycosylase [Bryobacteraceae bacterium]|nr:A/G-specific adenine glycosylase [Bryobacteraceae bacterium]
MFFRLWTRAPRIDRESSTTIESISRSQHTLFRKRLLDWFDSSARDLPWRGVADPYLIWISEVMLQQTRVTAVIPYYQRFAARFPTIADLASAPEEELLKAWAGLGYYSRARNLQKAAISMGRKFPSTYEEIRALRGVGDYTAAAVASIAFGMPHAAVDGNVVRVVSRLTNGVGDVRSEAEARLDRLHPGKFNEAMMELGATICLPRNPQCLLCPVAQFCEARAAGTQDELPPKKARKMVRVERTLLVIRRGEKLLFRRRPDTDRRLAGFWELPEPEELKTARIGKELGRFPHTITNFHNIFTIRQAEIAVKPRGYAWLSPVEPVEYLLSTVVRKALRLILKE